MIAWFVRNGVAANLLMVGIVVAGISSLMQRISTEVFPDFELDIVNITVPYRGSTPFESEEGVVLRIEEAIHDLEGIKHIRSTAAEGAGSVAVEIEKGYEPRELLDDIKNRVDAINTFPVDTEKPIVSLAKRTSPVITVVLSADMNERNLRELGEMVRDEISSLPTVTQVRLKAVRPYEIAIEVSEQNLRQYGLTLEAVAQAVSRTSIDLPAGVIKTKAGEILLRTKGQAYVQKDFEEIVLISRPDGTRLTIGDIANVIDGFDETPLYAEFNGESCVLIDVSRVGDQNAIDLAEDVKNYLDERQFTLPEGVTLTYWNDRSRIIRARLHTLTSSALQGGFLVFLVLTLFLRFSLALWVCLGIPVAFMGSIFLMPYLGVTINIFSLFGFILVLGIVVDDAIVTGENIYTHLQRGEDSTHACIQGTHEVAVPVVFGILTTVAAFTPLLMVEGTRGKIFAQIPIVIIPVLLFSLVESKLILPNHLRHLRVGRDSRKNQNRFSRFQMKFADGLENFARNVYQPSLKWSLKNRYLTFSIFSAVCIFIFTLLFSNRMHFVFFPRVASTTATAQLTMPQGTPIEITSIHIQRIVAAAQKLQKKYIDPKRGDSLIVNILSTTGSKGGTRTGGPFTRGGASGQSHVGEISFRIIPPEERGMDLSTPELVQEWRQLIGLIPGAQDLSFRAQIGPSSNPIDVQLTGPDFDNLSEASDQIKEHLVQYPDLFDITDSYQDGKQEVKLSIKLEAELLGLTMSDLARQTRQAFFGAEAQRIQRGREDIRVMVRYPLSERRSLSNLSTMRIRTRDGTEVPFSNVAEAQMGRGFSTIRRIDRNRSVSVTADADVLTANLGVIKEDLNRILPEIVSQYHGMSYTLEGEAREQSDSFGSLAVGAVGVLFIIYALLAIPFKSYVQPGIVMSVIPFGIAGAILGHLICGHNISMMSLFGMLALSGVVVNDSLVLVDYINRRRNEGMSLGKAVSTAGIARFRAIILTSFTTFVGLMPIMMEKSTQAQILIPMAISLGWGILFATFITLFLIPINYLILEDLKLLALRYWNWQIGKQT